MNSHEETSYFRAYDDRASSMEEQAEEIRRLQLRISELEDAVKRERHRAELSEQQLEHYLQQQQQQQQQEQQQPDERLEAAQPESAPEAAPPASPHAPAGTFSYGNVSGVRRVMSYSADGFPRPGAVVEAANGMVLISRKEYDLLLLKDRAISVLQEGMTIADCSLPDMPLIFANAGFAKITGYSVRNTFGKNCRFLQGEGTDPATLKELRDAIHNGRPCVVQLINYKKSGDPFVNYLSVTPIRNSSGKLTHYVGIQSDITELVNHRKAELAAKHEALQAAAATEAKSEFLARMSHEIRTPLNGMIAVGQLLAETSLSPAQWDLVNTIRCSGETLLVLITDILDFSRIEANKMVFSHSVFKLETVMEAAMEISGLRAAQKRLQVAYHISDSTPRVLLGDAQRLQQILLNILNNAVKFTEDGQVLLEVWAGHLEVSAQAAEEQHAHAQASAAAPLTLQGLSHMPSMPSMPSAKTGEGSKTLMGPKITLHFTVRDTGIGINMHDLHRLFSSFTQVDTSPTRRYGGSGLGLAISKKLCNAMEGDMRVESPGLGHGTTFSWSVKVRVPYVVEPKDQPKVRRRSALSLTARPQWTRLAELAGVSFRSTSGLSSADTDPGPQAADPEQQASAPGSGPCCFNQAHNRHLGHSVGAAGLGAESSEGRGSMDLEAGRGSEPGPRHHVHMDDVLAAALDEAGPRGKAAATSGDGFERLEEEAVEVMQVLGLGAGGGGKAPAAPRRPPGPSRSFSMAGAPPAPAVRVPANVNPLLVGKKILLVEPCNMIRQVLMLALHSWGCEVCAVSSQDQAVQQLIGAGTLPASTELVLSEWTEEQQAHAHSLEFASGNISPYVARSHASSHSHSVPQVAAAAARELHLRSAPDESAFKCKGPWDVVMMDMTFTRILRAITECNAAEAQRLVFMGWPGQSELENTDVEEWRVVQESAVVDLPDPVKSVADKPGSRQLGYVIVTRPVKQGRLMLALEEVLAMQLHEEPAAAAAAAAAACQPPCAHHPPPYPYHHHAYPGPPDQHHAHALDSAPLGPSLGHHADLTKSSLGGMGGMYGMGGLVGVGSASAAAGMDNFCGSSSTSSRLHSLGGDESYSIGPSNSNGHLSLGNSTLRPAAVVKKTPSAQELVEQSGTNAGNVPLRVLLAEDNAINMKVALGILKRIGVTDTVTVENGEAALQAVESRGGGDAFHLILMDLHMPIMGGMEAVRELKKRYPNGCAKVVAVTADAFEVTRDDCMSAGFDGWLPKPFRVEDMVKIVNETSLNRDA